MKNKSTENPQTKLIMIMLVIIGVAGFVYWEYTLISKKLDDVQNKQNELTQLKYQSQELEKREAKFLEVQSSLNIVDNYIAKPDELINFVEEAETLAKITNTKMSLQFEPVTLSDGGIIFGDEKAKQEILNEIKNKGSQIQNPTSGGNIALQLLETSKQTTDEDTSLNFLDINLIVIGSYDSIMDFIVSLKNSRYTVEIYDLQMVSRSDGVQATIQARLFIANQK